MTAPPLAIPAATIEFEELCLEWFPARSPSRPGELVRSPKVWSLTRSHPHRLVAVARQVDRGCASIPKARLAGAASPSELDPQFSIAGVTRGGQHDGHGAPTRIRVARSRSVVAEEPVESVNF